MYWWICSPILWVAFLFCWYFPLLYKKVLACCSPRCLSFCLFVFLFFVSLALRDRSNVILLQIVSDILLPVISLTYGIQWTNYTKKKNRDRLIDRKQGDSERGKVGGWRDWAKRKKYSWTWTTVWWLWESGSKGTK